MEGIAAVLVDVMRCWGRGKVGVMGKEENASFDVLGGSVVRFLSRCLVCLVVV